MTINSMTITKFKKYSKRGQIVPSQLLILNYLIFKMKKSLKYVIVKMWIYMLGNQPKRN